MYIERVHPASASTIQRVRRPSKPAIPINSSVRNSHVPSSTDLGEDHTGSCCMTGASWHTESCLHNHLCPCMRRTVQCAVQQRSAVRSAAAQCTAQCSNSWGWPACGKPAAFGGNMTASGCTRPAHVEQPVQQQSQETACLLNCGGLQQLLGQRCLLHVSSHDV
jgi:hypothetical protein